MEHILILVYTLAFAAGAASVSVILQLYREHRQELLRDYLVFLLLLGLCVAFNLAASYLENVLAPRSPLDDLGTMTVLVDLAGMALVGGIVHRIVKIMHNAVDDSLSGAIARIIFGVLLVVAAAVAASAPHIDGRQHLHAVPRAANLILIVAAVASTVRALVAARRLDGRRRATVRLFAGLHLAAFVTILVGFFAPPAAAWHLLAGAFLGLNIIPLVLLRALRMHRLARYEPVPECPDYLGPFAAEYGISARELEIVTQVLTGKTNPEMADALFISASTVKNHIYSIYRKCGVRNRVELAQLIQDVG